VLNVYILKDDGDCWPDVERCLRSVNANVIPIDPDCDPDDLKKRTPNLVIVGEGAWNEILDFRLRKQVMIIIGQKGRPGTITPSPDNEKRVSVGWPVTAEEFLNLTSELSRLAERRTFRSILRLFQGDSEFPVMGQSLDFSSSGLAFRSQGDFELGERLDVSFSLPGLETSLRLTVKIMRKADEVGGTTYGARFLGMDALDRRVVDEFVMQG
jgi:hypothetical protein